MAAYNPLPIHEPERDHGLNSTVLKRPRRLHELRWRERLRYRWWRLRRPERWLLRRGGEPIALISDPRLDDWPWWAFAFKPVRSDFDWEAAEDVHFWNNVECVSQRLGVLETLVVEQRPFDRARRLMARAPSPA